MISLLHPIRFVFLLGLALASLISRAAELAPITDEEAAEFGAAIAGYINTNKESEILKSFDGYALLDGVFKGLDVDDKFKQEFSAGFISSFGGSLENSFRQFSTARYLRPQTVDGEKRALVRFILNNGAVNYMAFVLARRASGSVKWIDAYNYMSGEKFTGSTRRALLPFLAQQKKSFVEKIISTESDYLNSMGQIGEANKLLQAGKYTEASAIYEGLPESAKNAQWILLLRLRCAQQMGDEAQIKIISVWEKLYPDDPALIMVSIDAHLIRKNFPAALESVRKLDQLVGGDPYILFLTGNIHLMAEEYAEAKKFARAALAADDTLFGAWDTLISVSIAEKNYAETVTVLDELATTSPGVQLLPEIEKGATYAAFRESEEFKAWAARQPKPAAQ